MTLPSDLETLGNRLEVAALRAVRRRARRQLILNALEDDIRCGKDPRVGHRHDAQHGLASLFVEAER